MTLCLAVACQENNEPRIVLCSDTRLDYGPLGSSQRTVKFDTLGHGWAVQWAGQPVPADELIEHLQPHFQSTELTTRARVIRAVNDALKTFQAGPLYANDTQLIISGFVQNKSLLITVWDNQNGSLEALATPVFAAIGEGLALASGMLSYRHVDPSMSMEQAAYCAYEAKRISQQIGTVGPITTLLWQAPPEPTMTPDLTNLAIFSRAGKEQLEEIFSRVGPQTLPDFSEFPTEFFVPIKNG